MNGSTGIQPTVELATTNGNGFFPYPVMYGNGGNNGGFGGEGALWLIVLLALIWGGNNNGNGGFFGNNGFDDGYAWLSNGQKEIMTNTNNGFDTLHLSNQLEGNRDAINNLSTQICNGFNGVEISAANRQMASMNQFFDLSRQFADCCCENRLGIANLGSDIAREACATRATDTQNTQSLLNAITGGVQSIKDQLCQDKIDQKNDEISQLRQEILYARGQASQIAQTQAITSNIYNELKNCPVGTVPVFGNQPIFTCSNNLGSGCGCNTTSQFI